MHLHTQKTEVTGSSEVFVPTLKIPLCQPTRLHSEYTEVMLRPFGAETTNWAYLAGTLLKCVLLFCNSVLKLTFT
jgi:hypothetical protein